MEFRKFRYILAIAEEGSITRAASRLYISQPSLSQLLSSVERELGSPLFDRATSPLKPTELGKIYLATAQKIIVLDKNLSDSASDLSNLKRGHIVIGSSPFRSTYLLANFLPRFQEKYPSITLELRESTTKELENMTLNSQVDFSLSLLPIDEKHFEFAQIFSEELLLVLPKEHILAKKNKLIPGDLTHLQTIDLKELADTSFIRMHPEQKLHQELNDLCRQAGFAPKIKLETRSMETALALTGAGLGASLLPEYLLQSFRPVNIPCYAHLTTKPSRQVVIIWRKNGYLSKAARTFITELTSFCQN